MHNVYLNSLKDSAEIIKKNLRHTLVKEYDFIFSSHFAYQALSRGFTTYEIYQILYKVCRDFRHKFSEETSLMIRYKDSVIICGIHHNVMGSFRRIIFNTIIKGARQKYTGYAESTLILDSI